MTHPLPSGLADYSLAAMNALTPDLRAYFLSGAGACATQAANEAAFAAVSVIPRHLRDLRGGSAAVRVAGMTLPHPFIVAPFAYQRLLCAEGEIVTAEASSAQDTLMTLSAQSSVLMEEVRHRGPTCQWFQTYWQTTREATLALCERAARAGFTQIMLTIDAPVQGVRDAEIASGFSLPEGISAVNLSDMPQPRFAPLEDAESPIFDRIAYVLPMWEDVAWLIENAPLPVMLKGVLHPEDAVIAKELGAIGVIVSNHGGRVLDGAIASLSALPDVRRAVGPDFAVLMDGGIRRGVDALKALALGADAVMVGRPVVQGLAVAGAMGISHVLRLLRDEFEIAMMLAGCRTTADITPACVHLNW